MFSIVVYILLIQRRGDQCFSGNTIYFCIVALDFVVFFFFFFFSEGENPLHKFVSHFEPVQYDHGTLMNEHHRVRRTIHGERHIDLQFKALGR